MSPSPPSTPKSPSFNGIFRNQRWLCNCDPRLDAVVKTVTQNPKNHGRRFYSCPNYGKGNYCDMFLFIDDAKARELECLMTNGRSEKRQTTLLESMTPSKGKRRLTDASATAEINDSQVGDNVASRSFIGPASTDHSSTLKGSDIRPSLTARSSTLKGSDENLRFQLDEFYNDTSDEDEDEEGTSNYNSRTTTDNNLQPSRVPTTPTAQRAGSKRKCPFEEEDLLDDLSSGGEEELITITESSSKAASAIGKQRNPNPFITPSVTRTTDVLQNGLPTPSLTRGASVKRVLFRDELAGQSSTSGANTTQTPKRQQLDGAMPLSQAAQLFGTDAIIKTPPSPSPPSSSPSSSSSSTNLTSEVMSLLKNENITPAVRSEVRKTLEKYVNQAKGYERGRDASRKAVKEAEDRTAAMQQKIDDLERSRQELRGQLMTMWGKI
ncbi:hypothetical protein FHL15_006022 [Xylaria flabelliformis]|uniref:GRF-type domain-containing protein n=1 Tax=Xylaria flabelliformis TaxID=2512241 RepID=A0A553HYZ1_9PEZI|nr:hypothetical protein FHL15_006022 [Xylaria flabelliformis]